ncbi:Maf family protein [Myxococcota bacterium]|nr:Maf family protein [Myxococcota bacterium]
MFVLASTSRYRRALLDQLRVPYVAKAPRFDEDHSLPLSPEELVITFARGKAESLAADFPELPIVGGDQTAELDGVILTKPGTRERAIEQLTAMSGRTHHLLTALAVHDPRTKTTEHAVLVHAMKMRALSRAAIEAYVDRDQPLDCAGAYKVESFGVLLFEEMSGPDHTAIVGLPITTLATLLSRTGVDLLTTLA